jgi:Protein of unknown function (DUF3025)
VPLELAPPFPVEKTAVTEGFLAVDWGSPWLSPLRPSGEAVVGRLCHVTGLPPLGQVAGALNALPCGSAHSIRFVQGDSAPHGEAYEAFVHRTAQVPTRDNLHDFFNGLVWRQFPLSKLRLNQLHVQAMTALGVGAVRGPVRDAMTVLDENGALLLAPREVGDRLWAALLARDWHGLFVTHRGLWAHARLVLFGHALMEQLVFPRKSITAHVWVNPFDVLDSDALDAALAGDLTVERLRAKPFTPLPVLGVPGWCPANESPGFYDDLSVFRPARPLVRAAQSG